MPLLHSDSVHFAMYFSFHPCAQHIVGTMPLCCLALRSRPGIAFRNIY